MTTYTKGQEAYYEELHQKNFPIFKELAGKMMKGILKIVDIRVDEPEFGHRRVIIYFHDRK